jgi:hypothetical protein
MPVGKKRRRRGERNSGFPRLSRSCDPSRRAYWESQKWLVLRALCALLRVLAAEIEPAGLLVGSHNSSRTPATAVGPESPSLFLVLQLTAIVPTSNLWRTLTVGRSCFSSHILSHSVVYPLASPEYVLLILFGQPPKFENTFTWNPTSALVNVEPESIHRYRTELPPTGCASSISPLRGLLGTLGVNRWP